LPCQVGKLVIAVEVQLVGGPTSVRLPPCQQALLNAGVPGGREQRREPVEPGEHFVRYASRRDAARPAYERRYPERTFPVRVLFVSERRVAAVRPRVHVRAVIS